MAFKTMPRSTPIHFRILEGCVCARRTPSSSLGLTSMKSSSRRWAQCYSIHFLSSFSLLCCIFCSRDGGEMAMTTVPYDKVGG
ncbi:hypothetical protein LZ31DRAFT_561205 [Colletotrichum somersetense]|nr:hypothetical protein LZ31DRAFT_561205 [Colletotrichum somersetense]